MTEVLSCSMWDLDGETMVLQSFEVRRPVHAWEHFVVHRYPYAEIRALQVGALETSEGAFAFPVKDNHQVLDGHWVPSVVAELRETNLLVTARIAMTTADLTPMLVLVDERSGLAVVEFGTDDDPNLRWYDRLRARFDRRGFESEFLQRLAPAHPDDEAVVDVTRPDVAPEFKRARYSGRGRRKGSW